MEELINNFIINTGTKTLIIVPVCFIFFDVLTGLLKAFKNRTVNSSISRDGFIKKIGWFLALLLGVFFRYILSSNIVLQCVSFTIIVTELISLVENLAELGVVVPILSDYCVKINQKKQ